MKLRCVGLIAVGLAALACSQTRSGRLEISVDGNGTTSPSTGSHAYASSTAVKVTATAGEGAVFAGWSGAAGGTANPVTVIVDGDRKLVAHFSPSSGGNTSSGGTSSSGGSSSGASSSGTSSSGASSSGGSSSGTSSSGASSSSGGASTTVSINAGGEAAGAFRADGYYSGGSTYSTTSEIDVSALGGSAPPASVFQSERYGEFTYTLRNRSPGTAQAVTLYFEESHWTGSGQRTFDVAIQGANVLTAFDIFAAAGGANKAVAKAFTTTADEKGRVVIQFIRSGVDQPKVCGLTVTGSESFDPGNAGSGPCDIYEAGGTPCVAAHSTVRALYGAYAGKLYQVRRADQATRDIGVLTPGGFADSASQDAFCAGTRCTVSIIYDQSPQANHLTLTSGGWIGNNAKEADAAGVKRTVGGNPVYGIHVPSGVGYRNNKATGTARGDEPEGMYMVANGKYYNDGCCFDYGNAETNSLDNGNGTMEAIYFGTSRGWTVGDGAGPWVMADLENGLFGGTARVNPNDKSITSEFVTATLKGKPHRWAIKAGDSQAGSLVTMYDGPYPSGGYDPMKKEGAIILGTGGDNSYAAVGDFFEGAMTSGYPSDETEDAVQANIVAAGYAP